MGGERRALPKHGKNTDPRDPPRPSETAIVCIVVLVLVVLVVYSCTSSSSSSSSSTGPGARVSELPELVRRSVPAPQPLPLLYDQDARTWDDGSRVGDNPDYPAEEGATISPQARGLEASPSQYRARASVSRSCIPSVGLPRLSVQSGDPGSVLRFSNNRHKPLRDSVLKQSHVAAPQASHSI